MMGKKYEKLEKRNKELNNRVNALWFIIFYLLIENMKRNSTSVKPLKNTTVWFPNGDKWEC